jgi:cell division protein FtsQ
LLASKPRRKNRYRKSPLHKGQLRRQGLDLLLALLQGAALMGAMSFLFLFCHDLLTQCDYFAARRVTVEGCRRLNAGQVIETAQIVHGRNTLALNLALARKRLLAHPWIAEAQINRELPDAIAIRIREHLPLAVVDLGKRFVLNEQGEIFKERQPEDPADLPLISGLEFSDFGTAGRQRSAAFSAVMEALALGGSGGAGLPDTVLRAITVDREIGLTLHVSDRVQMIKLGFDDYALKFQKLKAVLAFLESRPELSGLQSIDLLNINRVVVRPDREAPPAPGRKEA